MVKSLTNQYCKSMYIVFSKQVVYYFWLQYKMSSFCVRATMKYLNLRSKILIFSGGAIKKKIAFKVLQGRHVTYSCNHEYADQKVRIHTLMAIICILFFGKDTLLSQCLSLPSYTFTFLSQQNWYGTLYGCYTSIREGIHCFHCNCLSSHWTCSLLSVLLI